MLATMRIQEKGQVTIPSDIRKKLRLKKGDLVTFIVNQDGVVIQSVKVAVQAMMSDLEQSLEKRSLKLDLLLLACQHSGSEQAACDFGLTAEERSRLYMALQLQAQQALETIRTHSEQAGLVELDDDEINAEIQAARDAAASSHRS